MSGLYVVGFCLLALAVGLGLGLWMARWIYPERKQVEDALRESDRRLSTLISNLPGMAYRCRNDPHWTIEFVSTGVEHLTGYLPTDLINNQTVAVANLIHPQDQAQVWEEVQAAIQAQQPFQLTYRIHTATGEEKWVWEQGRGVFTDTGELLALEGFITDITPQKQAEAALKHSQERYLGILQYQTELVTRFQADGTLTFVNDAFCRYYGLSYEDVIEQDYKPRVYPEDQDVIDRCLAALSPENPVGLLQNRVICQGDVRWMEWTDQAIYDEAGNFIEFQAVGRDITKQKQAEDALQESEARFREIAATISQLFFIRAISGEFLYISPAYETIWGRSRDSLYQNSESWREAIHPDDRHWVNGSLVQQFQGNSVTRVYRIIRPEGAIRWIRAEISLLRDEAGQPLRFVGFAEDITDQKQAELALQQSEVHFRALFEQAALGIAFARLDGTILQVNRQFCDLLGYSEAELMALTFRDFNHPDDLAKTEAQISRLAAGDSPSYSMEKRYVRKDGSVIWVAIVVSMMQGLPQNEDLKMALVQDISDRKAAEQQLQAALAERDVLLREVHHRVKNNLQVICSMLQLQLRRTQDAEAREVLSQSQNRIIAINLVHDTLHRSNDLATLNTRSYITYLVHNIAQSYDISRRSIDLILEIEDALFSIDEAVPCGLILNELASNAIQHAFVNYPAGELRVNFFTTADEIATLIVQDNGLGLPSDDDLASLNSIGLMLVTMLVSQLKGNLVVDRNNGTRFTLTFPKRRSQ